MGDSEALDRLAAKHERNRERRVDSVKRWARYVRENPPEERGPQLNTLVDAQLRSARESDSRPNSIVASRTRPDAGTTDEGRIRHFPESLDPSVSGSRDRTRSEDRTEHETRRPLPR